MRAGGWFCGRGVIESAFVVVVGVGVRYIKLEFFCGGCELVVCCFVRLLLMSEGWVRVSGVFMCGGVRCRERERLRLVLAGVFVRSLYRVRAGVGAWEFVGTSR